MKKQLPKPENWQDFESLCKKLWGVVWEVPNKIKKNGRSGQVQHGVDIYAIPKNEKKYWGIQCKGKDEYTKSKLTKKEIDLELEKAENFTPKLEVFIFATTSNKDSDIEEYIRIKDIENKEKSSFEILLFCWEDIVDLIEENRDVYNFYMHSNKYKSDYDFEVFVSELENKQILLEPEFYKTTIKYKIKRHSYNPRTGRSSFGALDLMGSFGNYNKKEVSLSYCKLRLIMSNTGNMAIDNWKVNFKLEGECEFLGNYNKGNKGNGYGISEITSPGAKKTYGNESFSKSFLIPLIQKDTIKVDLWILPLPKQYSVVLNWEILARDFNKKGSINIQIKPKIEERTLVSEVEHHYEIKESRIKTEEKVVYK